MSNQTLNHVLMCKPTHYDVTYTINPWMKPGTVNLKKALQQWQRLVDVYQKLGVTVDTIEQHDNLPDMVFSTDSGISHCGTVLISNFRYEQRKSEWQCYAQWFEENGFSTTYLPDYYPFEGGDCLKWNDTLFIGTGFRTTFAASNYIGNKLRIATVPLTLISPDFYHLDTCLFFLDSYTAFYYPPAFSKESRQMLEQYIPYLLPFTKEEAYTFSANSVVIENNVLISKAAAAFKKRLKTLHINTIPIDVSEFIKSGGGIHCLTHIIN